MASGAGVSRLLAVGGVCVALVAAHSAAAEPTIDTAPASAPPVDGGVAELTVGDWSGIGFASGVAYAVQGQASLAWEAAFEAPFKFTVTESDTTGTVTLTSSGLFGEPMMKMLLSGLGGQEVAANWNISPPARGTIDGDRSLLVFNAGSVTTSGFIDVPGIGPQEISGIPSQVTIDNTIEHLECSSATGNWNVSVLQQIEGQGWNATWNGAWVAFPVPEPLQQTEAEALVDGLEELFSDFNDFSLTASNAIDPEATYDPASIDRDEW